MKQYKVFVQMANNRYCHDIVTANGETPECIKEAENKAIELAEEILSRYKGDGAYCFVYIHDENYTIVYEKDNIAISESKGDQISLESIETDKSCRCQLAEGFTKEGNRKFIAMQTDLVGDVPKTYFHVYCCDDSMIATIKQRKVRLLKTAIEYFNKM